MRKKRAFFTLITLILAMLCAAAVFAGCGAKEATSTEAETEAVTEEATEAPAEDATDSSGINIKDWSVSYDEGEVSIKNEKTDQVYTFKFDFSELYSTLSGWFDDKDIDGSVDEETGDVTLPSDILFEYDSYELSDEGKATLDDFVESYTSVVLSDENKASVNKIIVEGHTDTQGTHEYNQKLSEKRAQAVMDYCVSVNPDLKPYITAKGYSYDKPIKKADGSVDMAASRRVVFRLELKEE